MHTAILTLKVLSSLILQNRRLSTCFNFQEGFEGQMTEDNIEIGICNSDGFRRLSPQARPQKLLTFLDIVAQEVKDYLANIQ